MAVQGGGAPALADAGTDGGAAPGGATVAQGSKPRPKEASRRPAADDKKQVDAGKEIIKQVAATKDQAKEVHEAVGEKIGELQDDAEHVVEGAGEQLEEILGMQQTEEELAAQAGVAPEARPGAWTRIKRRLAPRIAAKGPRGGAPGQESFQPVLKPEDKKRLWELKMQARSMMYVGKDTKIDTFFAVSLIPTEKRLKDPVRLLPEYTPATVLVKEVAFTPRSPIVLWARKYFKLSYKELDSYALKIAMWKVSPLSFNTFYGIAKRSLKTIVNRDANIDLTIKEKLTKQEEEEKKKKRRPVSDVAVFSCTVNFEEVFDFQLIAENWNLEMLEQHHDYKKRKDEKKCLKFVVPKDSASDASRSRRCAEFRVDWKEGKFNWSTLGAKPFVFRGTSTALQNQYFIIKVFSGKPQFQAQPPTKAAIGTALLGLTSVLDISVFKGNVKALDTEEERFNVATVTGSLKAMKCSVGEKGYEEVPGGRPEQPRSASTVSHLNKGRYLVVRVTKCDHLAVADPDKGSSDPYLRATWDSMVLTSPILKFTTKPVFNHTFFFPVRLFNQKLEKQKKYRETALLYEMKSKGDIQIQVWDADDTSSDSLGAYVLPLWQLLQSKQDGVRTLQGSIGKPKGDEEEEEENKGPKQWYEQKLSVRYYDGSKTPLQGCTLPNAETAMVYFEAYFYPDWKDDIHLGKTEGDGTANNVWQEKEKEFNKDNVEFYKAYAVPFPDAIGARPCKDEQFGRTANLRRFPCIARHPQMPEMWLPLMAFLCRIITPEEYLMPPFLLHWINCMPFDSSSRQERQGRVPDNGWKDPQTFLFTRKGPVQDHALLLCSVLLGSKKDAWVCKGLIKSDAGEGTKQEQKLVEHTWVMTREQGDWVTFWEPCTREVFHLPKRWHPPKTKKKKRHGLPAKHGANGAIVAAAEGGEIVEALEDEEEEQAQAAAEEWDNEIADMRLGLEDIEGLPTVGRMPKPKQKVASKRKAGARDKLREQLIAQRENLPQAPKKDLLEDESTLVDWLPYDSIDVCFNDTQLYANRQNHHPACITFDFDAEDTENKAWTPLLSEEDKAKCQWRPINLQVVIDPVTRNERLVQMEQEMISEFEENMRLYRQKAGLDTFIEKGEKLVGQIDAFIMVLEEMRTLDLDHCPIWDTPAEEWTKVEHCISKWGCGSLTTKYNKFGTAFSEASSDRYRGYDDGQKRKWAKVVADIEKFLKSQEGFPTAKGKVFKGFPVHFSTSDKEEIRSHLMGDDEYQELLNRKQEGLLFTIHCRMFGMLGGIQSTWLYFGVQIGQEDYDPLKG